MRIGFSLEMIRSIYREGVAAAPVRGQTVLAARQRKTAIAYYASLHLLLIVRLKAEDHVDYRFGYYDEDSHRIKVETHSWLFETAPAPWISLKGDVVYDAISGATPTGAPTPAQIQKILQTPLPGPLANTVPTELMRDIRWAGSLEAGFNFGRHHIRPEFSYSSEHDYLSRGMALNYSLDLNGKNTTLNLGWSHDWDDILVNPAAFISETQHKDTDEIFAGVNQLLSPATVLTANLTYRKSRGYLADPYRGVVFDGYLDPVSTDPNNPGLFGEVRPGHRTAWIGFLSLSQFVSPLNAGAEASYRFSHDSFSIDSHTIELDWRQKFGKKVVVSPLFRYYRQTAANFYATDFAGDPTNPTPGSPISSFYSADYRLSSLETFTWGVDVTVKPREWLTVDLGYKRYEMLGLDAVTSASAYPKANIFTLGVRFWY